jgi:hypothetical protein
VIAGRQLGRQTPGGGDGLSVLGDDLDSSREVPRLAGARHDRRGSSIVVHLERRAEGFDRVRGGSPPDSLAIAIAGLDPPPGPPTRRTYPVIGWPAIGHEHSRQRPYTSTVCVTAVYRCRRAVRLAHISTASLAISTDSLERVTPLRTLASLRMIVISIERSGRGLPSVSALPRQGGRSSGR